MKDSSSEVVLIFEQIVWRVDAWKLGHDVSLLPLAATTHVIIAALVEHHQSSLTLQLCLLTFLLRRDRSVIPNATAFLLFCHPQHEGSLELLRARLLWVDLVFDFFEHLLHLLFNCLWIKLVGFHDVRQFALDIQLVVFFNHLWVELWDRNLVVPDKDNAVRVRASRLWRHFFVVHPVLLFQLRFTLQVPLACRDCLRDLALIMHFGLCLVKLVFDVSHHAWMPLYHVDKFAHFLILVLQVVSQSLVMLKQVLVLLVKRLELAVDFCEVQLLLLVLFLESLLVIFLGALSRLSESIDFVPQSGHLLLLQFVHLLLQVHLLAADEQLFLQFPDLVFVQVLLSVFVEDLCLSDLLDLLDLLSNHLD